MKIYKRAKSHIQSNDHSISILSLQIDDPWPKIEYEWSAVLVNLRPCLISWLRLKKSLQEYLTFVSKVYQGNELRVSWRKSESTWAISLIVLVSCLTNKTRRKNKSKTIAIMNISSKD